MLEFEIGIIEGRCAAAPLSLFTFLLALLFILAELALLDAHQDVLVGAALHLRVSYDVFGVLPCTHSKVTELTILLAQLFEGTLGLHNEITDEGADLHSW